MSSTPARVSAVMLLLSATVFQRFGLNFGSYSANASLLAGYLFLLTAALVGALMVSLTRFALYALAVAGACASLWINADMAWVDRTSSTSLYLLVAMYLPFVFVLKRASLAPRDTEWIMRAFLDIALLCAIAGIAQFYVQFVFRPDWLFNFMPYMPQFLRGPDGYNTIIKVGALYKSNGFFFLEPSHFSFAMGLALTAEAASYRRVSRMITCALALLLSYSGTGILALAIGMMFPLGRRTLTRAVAILSIGALLLTFLGEALNLSFTLGRVGEFSNESSSAYQRYVAPLHVVLGALNTESWTFWLGHGPGSMLRLSQNPDFHDPTWARLAFEYGLVGLLSIPGLYLLTFRGSDAPVQVRALLYASWLIMGGYLLTPDHNFLSLALVGLLPRARDVREAATAPAYRYTGQRVPG